MVRWFAFVWLDNHLSSRIMLVCHYRSLLVDSMDSLINDPFSFWWIEDDDNGVEVVLSLHSSSYYNRRSFVRRRWWQRGGFIDTSFFFLVLVLLRKEKQSSFLLSSSRFNLFLLQLRSRTFFCKLSIRFKLL